LLLLLLLLLQLLPLPPLPPPLWPQRVLVLVLIEICT